MGTGKKIFLWVGIPLLIIIILYFVFFGKKKPTTNERIAQINATLQTSRLSSDQVQALLTEKHLLQS